jgi:hypothetical protein
MAKHKLSSGAKEKLRTDLKDLLAKGKAAWSSLVELGKKYRVSPETVRWHLKTVRGGTRGARLAKIQKQKPPSSQSKKTTASSLNGIVGASVGLLAMAERYGEEGLKRAIRAARLLPRWRAKLRKLGDLRRVEAGVRRSIRALTHQAGELEKKIRSLTKK